MTHAIATLSDWMLSRLLPAVRVEAACNVGYRWTVDCGCRLDQETGRLSMYGKMCEVLPGCKTRCGSCFAYDYC
jgi:hypothetical protein